MTRNRTFKKFLATFDEAAAPAATPPAPVVVPVAAPAAPVPVTMSPEQLGTVIDLAIQRSRVAPPATAAPPARVAAPAAGAEIENETSPNSIKALRQELAASNARAEAAALGTYRLTAINALRATGRNLIESLVFGNTQAEVDQSIAFAVQEYDNYARAFAAANPAPAPVAPVVETPVNQVPQGVVTQQAQPTAQQPAVQPQNTDPNLPGFVNAPNLPQQQQEGLDPATFQALTSSHGVRNGSYAANREALMAGLQAAAGHPGGQPFAFNPGYQLAPPVPRGMPAIQGQQFQAPAMVPNVYAGVSMPQVRPQAGIIQQQQRQAPQQQGFPSNYQQPVNFAPQQAPQPQALDQGTAQLDAGSVGAAHAAAQASIQGARARANLRPTH